MELPIKLSAQEKENYPEFTKLISQLSSHIEASGCSKSLKKELNESRAGMEHERLKWLQHSALYAELQDAVLEEQARITASATPAAHGQFYKAVQECLTFAEIGDYIDCHPDPASQTTLLGLNKDDVYMANPYHKHIGSIQQKLVPEIEERLRQKCDLLVDFHHSSSDIRPGNERLAEAMYSQLPALLENDRVQTEEQERRLRQEREQRGKQYSQYHQTLVESLETLEQLVTKHRLKVQSDCDKTTSNWLTARCDAMCLKIKMLELQLMCDTYHAATVQALTKIRNQLDMNILETQHELSTTQHALKAYQAVGMGFDDLVREYTQLRDEVDNKKWAVRELRESTAGSRSQLDD